MTTSPSFDIDQLLRIEDDSAIIDFCCPQTGLPLWPQIRISVYRMIMTELLFASSNSGAKPPVPLAKILSTLTRSVAHNAWLGASRGSRADICLISDGIGNQHIDGKWFNRLTDHFVSISSGNTLTLEDHFEWNWPFPRQDGRVYLLAPARTYHFVTGKLKITNQHRGLARDLVDFARERALRYLGWSMNAQQAQQLASDLTRKIASMPQQYQAYERMLARIRPRLLMIGSACFGGAYATIVVAARNMGIATAEYQHGAVSMGHDGYNFAPALRASAAYCNTLPDYFLSYGEWWNGQFNAPVNRVVIGSADREAQLAKTASVTGEQTDILILSDGMEIETYLELAKAVEPSARKRSLDVVIRPHPLEASAVRAQYGAHVGNVRIDQNPDIVTSLRKAKVVVSELSTGLFEAVGLAENIYIWDTPKARFAFPQYPFRSFSSAKGLVELIEAELGTTAGLNADAFWAPNWRGNYKSFLSKFGIEQTIA